ncbi:MAG: hypothetical protein H3C69_09895, partial [Candidatus Promineofilum sp.]|nr:hypothetical protein [Promineifilum sp.]
VTSIRLDLIKLGIGIEKFYEANQEYPDDLARLIDLGLLEDIAVEDYSLQEFRDGYVLESGVLMGEGLHWEVHRAR